MALFLIKYVLKRDCFLSIYIYIYIDLTNFVNVTMYCYRHVIRILCYYMYSWICKVAEENRCLTRVPVLKDRRSWPQDHGLNTCFVYHMTQASLTYVLYPDWNYTLYTFCHGILYSVHCNTTVLLNYTISGKIGIDEVT